MTGNNVIGRYDTTSVKFLAWTESKVKETKVDVVASLKSPPSNLLRRGTYHLFYKFLIIIVNVCFLEYTPDPNINKIKHGDR